MSGLIATLFHNVFNFFSVPGQLSLEVANIPGTSKFLGSSLTRTCFFFKQKMLFQLKLSANYLSAYLLSASYLILKLLFFGAHFSLMLFLSVLFTPQFCNFINRDFVFPCFLFR